MSKTEMLKILRLPSAMESVMLVNKQTIPDYLYDDINRSVEILEREILND